MGIADDVLSLCEVCDGLTWVFNGKEALHVDIVGKNLTDFSCIFCLEQGKAEEVMLNRVRGPQLLHREHMCHILTHMSAPVMPVSKLAS